MVLDEQLTRLATLSPAELRQAWQAAFEQQPPNLSADLLRHGIAYRLQEAAVGALPAKRELARLAAGKRGAPSTIKPGTRLVRSWNGRTINVEVTDEGFRFEGRTYRSLSSIAREVTGAHWSGPRFFGLRDNG